MKLNTESNVYTIVYVTIVVIIVAFLLAFTYAGLKERSDINEQINKKQQILASLNQRNIAKESVDSIYKSIVKADLIVNQAGEIIKEGKNQDQDGFEIARKDYSKDCLPIYQCEIEGQKKYVLPMVGKGLWGSIWGYISLNEDGKTIYGAYFAHESETAGLGALINEQKFQKQFENQTLIDTDGTILEVVKSGQAGGSPIKCDGITGATLTSNGVNQMIQTYVKFFQAYLDSVKQ
ncbi:MAG: NADH:ubiquinone reductase (Na(+)-transporting) subunit C [Alloprevotella sp.]|nr:NADH:ubiquinone reductase (Na(+)-transporting) subunit C [Alloprevotella sp.]